jgi:hypothetical protein
LRENETLSYQYEQPKTKESVISTCIEAWYVYPWIFWARRDIWLGTTGRMRRRKDVAVSFSPLAEQEKTPNPFNPEIHVYGRMSMTHYKIKIVRFES